MRRREGREQGEKMNGTNAVNIACRALRKIVVYDTINP